MNDKGKREIHHATGTSLGLPIHTRKRGRGHLESKVPTSSSNSVSHKKWNKGGRKSFVCPGRVTQKTGQDAASEWFKERQIGSWSEVQGGGTVKKKIAGKGENVKKKKEKKRIDGKDECDGLQ